MAYVGGSIMTKAQMSGSKSQFYHCDGTGRDTYVYNNNGGFCPFKTATKIEELGTFYHTKQRPRDAIPLIHSKGVAYVNNGGGRDTYISSSAGGLRILSQPGHFKTTFYNNLRVYAAPSGYKRTVSSTATLREKGDVFTCTQQHFDDKFNKEQSMIRNYQRLLDSRLSRPKLLSQMQKGRRTFVTKNTVFDQLILNSEEDEEVQRIRDCTWKRAESPSAVNNYKKYQK